MALGWIASARGISFAINNRLFRRINNASPGRFDMASSSSSSSSVAQSGNNPLQCESDDGRRWWPCAGVAALNSKGEILIGERIGKPGSWQAPQGGIDGSESVFDAAIREMYEEVGLEHGRHVLLETTTTAVVKCKYETEGTRGWLEDEGYAGQELNWVVFRCTSSDLEMDPSLVCTLSGLNGERPEFSAVRWEGLDRVVDDVWEKKALPYRALRDYCVRLATRWEERCAELDLGGRWSRDNGRNVGVEEALVARGLSPDDASRLASEPYLQSWRRHSEARPSEWIVTTYRDDGWIEIRRELHYPIGEFEERYEGTSTIFGGGADDGGGGVARRRCFYLADADANGGVAHVAVSTMPDAAGQGGVVAIRQEQRARSQAHFLRPHVERAGHIHRSVRQMLICYRTHHSRLSPS
ncbi:hypothetical protein ACHAW5_007859 [Stephanodiscus triporus]|uniref:Nudix hydrolase domain-containing protein n=1 Tax=Stephanodiscus triporus TaxID=2934178 RepID=A0ABD3P3B2_9STRA